MKRSYEALNFTMLLYWELSNPREWLLQYVSCFVIFKINCGRLFIG